MKSLLLAAILTFISLPPVFGRDFVKAGTLPDSMILVDLDQLKKSPPEIALVKYIRHFFDARDYGFEHKAQAEEYLALAGCNDRTKLTVFEHRFLSLEPMKVLKSSTYALPGGSQQGNAGKDTRVETIAPGSAASIAVDFACSWLQANR